MYIQCNGFALRLLGAKNRPALGSSGGGKIQKIPEFALKNAEGKENPLTIISHCENGTL